jgi:membrane protease YdiL (CAAX protease family)
MTDEHATTSPTTRERGWKAFWDRGGWWKAVAFAVVYLAAYQFVPLLASPWLSDMIDQDDLFATPESVFAAVAFPLLVGSILLVVFALTVQWLPRPLFGRQPVKGSWWMWFAPVLVLIPILLRVFGTDYGRYSASVIAVTFLAGVLVGFSEELLTRGVVVVLLRRAGYREWVVAALSTLVFGLLHSSNLLTGQDLFTVGYTIVFTLCFGVLMYLTMRVTGSIIWAMVLHALTDPTTLLAAGGIDEQNVDSSALTTLAGPATILLMIGAVVLLRFIRGDAKGRASAEVPERVVRPGEKAGPTAEDADGGRGARARDLRRVSRARGGRRAVAAGCLVHGTHGVRP